MIESRQWPEADALLDEALALPVSQRHAFLQSRIADPALFAALAAVIDEAERTDAFLDPAIASGRPLIADLNNELASQGDGQREAVLSPGDRFGTYEVVELIGRGGMGEVYRARDPRLGRDVALKVLPRSFVDDAQRLARFEREARLLAALNHPNVGAIYGLAEQDGRQALVLEHVGGVTLADRIAVGPLPLEEALSIARQVALALEAAHQRSIVHRDLKPANMKITADGTVKVLDFGLARAVGPEAPDGAGAGLTAEWKAGGAVLGTPAYMSPEQARGEGADERWDIWAFGCVFYEMLTGVRAFPGDSASELLARILAREPDFDLLPRTTPDAIRRLLRRTLTKDPRRRLAHISDALLEIEDAEGGARHPAFRWVWRGRSALAAAMLLLAGLVAGVLVPRVLRPADVPVTRVSVPIPDREDPILSLQQVAALSPDGRTLVYRAQRDGEARLFRRSLDALMSTPIPGTENASGPFFSPDGAWLGFDGEGVLRKIALAGGSPVTICDARGGSQASWGGDTIVFATTTARVLQRVAASGGAPTPLTALDPDAGDLAHAFPHVLPRGDAALFTIVRANERRVAAVRFDDRHVTVLTTGSQPRYVPGGYLVFVRDDTLWAASFDERRLTLTTEPVPVLGGLDIAGGNAAHYAVSGDGTLLYVPRREDVRDRQLVWVDRRGVERPLPLANRRYSRAALASDGRRIALAIAESANTDIWIADADRDALIRVTRDAVVDTAPLWSPDGSHIVFRSERDGGGLFMTDVNAAGPAERLTTSAGAIHTPHGWTPDGRTLLFTVFHSYTRQSIAARDPGSPDGVRRLLDGDFAQLRPQVSPEGRWLAYQSDESGRFEIYVRPYPAVATGHWRVSTEGGTTPRWTKHGRELTYYDGRGVMAIPVRGGSHWATGTPQRLFDYSPLSSRVGPDYDVSADGERFLMIRRVPSRGSRAQLVLVQNWIRELRAQLGEETQ